MMEKINNISLNFIILCLVVATLDWAFDRIEPLMMLVIVLSAIYLGVTNKNNG